MWFHRQIWACPWNEHKEWIVTPRPTSVHSCAEIASRKKCWRYVLLAWQLGYSWGLLFIRVAINIILQYPRGWLFIIQKRVRVAKYLGPQRVLVDLHSWKFSSFVRPKQYSGMECTPRCTPQKTKVGMVTAWNNSVSAWCTFHIWTLLYKKNYQHFAEKVCACVSWRLWC